MASWNCFGFIVIINNTIIRLVSACFPFVILRFVVCSVSLEREHDTNCQSQCLLMIQKKTLIFALTTNTRTVIKLNSHSQLGETETLPILVGA